MSALVLAASDLPAAPVVALMGLGVIVGLFGHLAGSRRTVATGIAILFAATALMIAGAYVAFRDDESDPRPENPPSEPRF